MILDFSVQNFKSHKSTKISFKASPDAFTNAWRSNASGEPTNIATLVFGHPNAGSTSTLEALVILTNIIQKHTFLSHVQEIPTNISLESEITSFRITTKPHTDNSRTFDYSVDIKHNCILFEQLLETDQHGSTKLIFERDIANDSFSCNCDEVSSKVLQNLPEQTAAICHASSAGMTAARDFSETFKNTKYNFFLGSIKDNLLQIPSKKTYSLFQLPSRTTYSIHKATQTYVENPEIFNTMKSIITKLDMDVDDIDIIANEDGTYNVNTIHNVENNRFNFTLAEEPSGLNNIYVLLSYLLPVLKDGGLCIFDDFDDGLHPHLANALVNLMKADTCNNKAQILYSCKNSQSTEHVNNDQIFVTTMPGRDSVTRRVSQVKPDDPDYNMYHRMADLDLLKYLTN